MSELTINHPQLRELHSYWLKKKADQRWPRRVAIDPVDLGFCLGYLALAEIETPFRVRYRLVGTKLCELYGADPTGFYIDQLYTPGFRSHVLAAYRNTVEQGTPFYDEPFFGVFRFRLGYYRLLLPLSTDGERVDRVLSGIYPADRRITRAEDWRSLNEVRNWLVEENIGPFLR